MKVVIIPGFGNPHIETKCDILRTNLRYIGDDAALLIFCYATEGAAVIPEDLLHDKRIMWVFEKGILAEFLALHAAPHQIVERFGIDNPEIMIILDDIELCAPVDWTGLKKIKEACGVHIVSPTLTERTMSYWPFMVHDTKYFGRIQSVCELFCYYMDFDAYKKYFQYVDAENPWMWGMDFILYSVMGLKSLLLNTWNMKHHFKRTDDASHARSDSDKYLKKYGLEWANIDKDHIILGIIESQYPRPK
jgi:hypothetical protein